MAKKRTKVNGSDVLKRVFPKTSKRMRRKFLQASPHSKRGIKALVYAWIKAHTP